MLAERFSVMLMACPAYRKPMADADRSANFASKKLRGFF
jgi:hypothetical protein